MNPMFPRLLTLLLIVLLPAQAWAADPLAAAILNFEGKGVAEDMPETLSSIVRNEALQIEKYQVVNQYPIKLSDLLLALGCSAESPTCLQQVAEQTKARVLIYGMIERKGANYRLQLNIFDSETGRMLNRLSRTITDTTDPIVTFRKEIEAFFDEERGAATTRLQIGSSVEGAQIRINDTFVGVVPLERKGLPPGTYTVEVSHPEHEVWRDTVTLATGADLKVWAQLAPRRSGNANAASPATVGAEPVRIAPNGFDVADSTMPESVGTTNWGAWSAVFVGGAALGGALGLGIALEDVERTIERESAAGTLTEGRYDELFNRGENFELAHRVLLGVGAVAVVAGVVWLVLDDDEDAAASIELGVGPGGVNASLEW